MTGTADLRACDWSAAIRPLIGQQRRIDPAGQVAQLLQRLRRVLLQLSGDRHGLRRLTLDDPRQQAELHRQRHDLLLRAVVQVALELAALLVLRRDEALT